MSHTILCIEDERETGDLMKAILEREGYAVIRMIDGRQAFDAVDSVQPPSLILLDTAAPYADGFKLLARLRDRPNWREVPIVRISAGTHQPESQPAMDECMAVCVLNNPGLQNLLPTLRRILQEPSAHNPEPQQTPDPPSTPKVPHADRPTVMIVEDHQETASLLRLLLEQEGYAVIHTANGESAHQLAVTTAPPALILLDLTLPSMTGLELLRIVRMTPEWQWTPVFVLSADTTADAMARAASLGATQYVQKPFIAERLLQSIRKFSPMRSAHEPHSGKTD